MRGGGLVLASIFVAMALLTVIVGVLILAALLDPIP